MKILLLSITSAAFAIFLFSAQNAFAGCIMQQGGEIDSQSVVSDGHLYKTYFLVTGCTSTTVFFKPSNDNGTTFKPAIEISNSTAAGDQVIAASGNNVYIAWQQYWPNDKLLFRKSTDNGTTFGNIIVIGQPNAPVQKKIIISKNYVEIVWEGLVPNVARVAYITISKDNGTSFEPPIVLSNRTQDTTISKIQQSGDTVYVHMEIYGECHGGGLGCPLYPALATFDVNDPRHTQKLIIPSNPVPEFPLVSLVLITSILLIIMVSAKAKLRF